MIAGITAQGGRRAGGGSAAHRYWRVVATEVNGGNAFGVVEVNFLGADGESLVGGGVAFASSRWDSGHAAANAFDGKIGTTWCSANGAPLPQYIGYQFIADVEVHRYEITARSSGDTTQAPKVFKLQYSDDGTIWTDRDERLSQILWSGNQKRSYAVQTSTPDEGQYYCWRILVVETNGAATCQISEIEMHVAGGGNVTHCPPDHLAISSPIKENSYPAYKAFDGIVGDGWFNIWWSRELASGDAWIGYQSEVPFSINAVKMWPRQGEANQAPKAFKIQATNNPITGEWVDIWSVSNQTGWQWMVPRTFTKP